MRYKAKYAYLLTALYAVVSCSLKANDNTKKYNPDSIPSYVANEVIIESFKQNRGLYLQPLSATLLSEKEIAAKNIVNIKEFTALIPNLYMPDYGSKMTSPVYIRGIGSRTNAPSVALYVDGVPYFDRASFDLNINDVESIEVLRGPQGTIYGRNTMGGVINIFTKNPLLVQETNINLTAGSHHTYKVAASHYNKLSKNLALSLSANYGHSGGYFKNIYLNKKADPIDEVATRARLSWRIKPMLTLDLILAYEYSDQNGYPYRAYNTIEEKVEVKEINYNHPSYYRRNMSTNGFNVSYTTERFKLGSQTSFQFLDGKQGLDQDFTEKDLYYVDFYHRQQMYSQEFNIKSIQPTDRYKWQFGTFVFHQNYAQNNDTDRKHDKIHLLQNAKNPSTGFALYHQSTYEDLFVKKLSASFGIRYDWETTSSTLIRSQHKYQEPLQVAEPVKHSKSFSQVTPKFSVSYSFQNNGVAYVSVTRGYKTGGFNNTAEVEEERSFDPEYSWSYEVGAKSSFINNLLHFDISLFFIDWRDQQISQRKKGLQGPGVGYLLRNAGKSQSKGIEFTAQLNLCHNFEAQLSYGYTHAKFKDYNNGDKDHPMVFDNNFIPMVPSNTFSASTSYTIDLNESWIDNITLNLQYVGLGKIYWNDSNTIQQSLYSLLNSKITLRKKDISLEFWAKNMTNERYISYQFNALENDFVQYGKPFHCGVNVSIKI